MKSKYKKVELASIEEFSYFLKQHKKIKYLDVILGDLSGIIRGKRIPISDADKIFKSGVQFVIQLFYLIPLVTVQMQKEGVLQMVILMLIIIQ